jgi:hypothetical protein
MEPRIFHSDMTKRWYVSTHYRDLGGGKFQASVKYDVTDQMNAILAKEVTDFAEAAGKKLAELLSDPTIGDKHLRQKEKEMAELEKEQ